MVKAELLRWYASIETDKMPRYIEISDANESQIFLNGCWQNAIYVWSILFDGKNWKYVETDSDRGYVFDLKSFSSENEASGEIFKCYPDFGCFASEQEAYDDAQIEADRIIY